ncbi:MAG: hypothetical protein HY586_06660 [Candidatus Omnitrophica bacterium]|nr:hypothetical protein [Candidatus Omnitrophota bacterium]
MSYEHKELAEGRWGKLSFLEQMANIGSEVERALNWQAKNNRVYSEKAFCRALELMDLTLDAADTFPRRKEIARVREIFADYFFGENEFQSSAVSWRSYFSPFAYAVRKNY